MIRIKYITIFIALLFLGNCQSDLLDTKPYDEIGSEGMWENENLVNRFIKEYNTFHKAEEKTLMPHINNTDGFYYALLKTED